MKKDILMVYHEFIGKVVSALNASGLKAPEGDFGAALLVVVHPEHPDNGEPVGGSVNYDTEKGQWVPIDQAEQPERVRPA